MILYEETLEQLSLEDVAIPKLLASQGMVPGIKVDQGKGPLVNAPGDEITYGLDGLAARLEHYKAMGARFAKWRDVFHISDTLPSIQCRGAGPLCRRVPVDGYCADRGAGGTD